MIDSPLLTREDMLELLRIRSLTTLDAMVRAGEIPAPQRFGDSRRLFWHRATIDAFLAEKFALAPPKREDPPALRRRVDARRPSRAL
jgi:predicted DNA-binding transcriptional regulator AlpA